MTSRSVRSTLFFAFTVCAVLPLLGMGIVIADRPSYDTAFWLECAITFALAVLAITIGSNLVASRIVAPLADTVESHARFADGDLTARAGGEKLVELARIGEALNHALERLGDTFAAMHSGISELSHSSGGLTQIGSALSAHAEDTSQKVGAVAAASDQAGKNVQTVATGTEEMTLTIKEIAKNAAEAARVATGAVATAKLTNDRVVKLGESSHQIGNVVKVIMSIAEQTNLLALNATIEAARAGDAGKGFAVVANEVKELAKETAKATEDISRKIGAIQEDTRGAVVAIGEITQVISQINDIQNTIASAVEEQAATTSEIGRNLHELARASQDITQNVGTVAKSATSTSECASQTRSAASQLAALSAKLDELVGTFHARRRGTVVTPPRHSSPIPVIHAPSGTRIRNSNGALRH